MPLKIYTYIAGDMAALVQRGGKLPLSNKVDGSENSCCCITRFSGERFFMVTFFVAESFLHSMKVLNAFQAISKGLNLKVFQGSKSPDPLVASR